MVDTRIVLKEKNRMITTWLHVCKVKMNTEEEKWRKKWRKRAAQPMRRVKTMVQSHRDHTKHLA